MDTIVLDKTLDGDLAVALDKSTIGAGWGGRRRLKHAVSQTVLPNPL